MTTEARSVLYVRLPCWKIYPGGVIYVADYIHKQRPDIDQHLLDLAIVPPAQRKRVLKQRLQEMQPDVVAFSWRNMQSFGPHPEDDALDVVMNFGAYWFSDKIVLGMYRARQVDPSQAPGLYQMVERLAQKAGLPTPRVYVIPQEQPNAFATGRNPDHAVVAVTQGILRLMTVNDGTGLKWMVKVNGTTLQPTGYVGKPIDNPYDAGVAAPENYACFKCPRPLVHEGINRIAVILEDGGRATIQSIDLALP